MNTQRSSLATPLSILVAGIVLVLLMMFGGSSLDFSNSVNAYPIGNHPTSVVATATAGVPVQPTALPGQAQPDAMAHGNHLRHPAPAAGGASAGLPHRGARQAERRRAVPARYTQVSV